MQLFHERDNLIARASLVLLVLLIAGGGGAAYYVFTASPWVSRAGQVIAQPVPFSHKHHVDGVGLDCRYCHASVETSAFAGVPPTQICMNCHTDIWVNSPMLAEDRQSWATDRPIHWNRVYDLADFVYFNHSIHIAKGIGCVSCHGRVDRMPLTEKQASLRMAWCLDCHRDPAPNLRPRDAVFDMAWRRGPDTPSAATLVRENHVDTAGLTDCSVCHR